MNKDQIKGTAKSAKGKVKESTGKAFGNKRLEAEGKANRASGIVQKAYGDAKEDLRRSTK